MAYVEGFVVAVPTANKEEYRKHAADAAPLFKEFGVSRMVECWGDDVPDGKVNDFKGAVQAKPDDLASLAQVLDAQPINLQEKHFYTLRGNEETSLNKPNIKQ